MNEIHQQMLAQILDVLCEIRTVLDRIDQTGREHLELERVQLTRSGGRQDPAEPDQDDDTSYVVIRYAKHDWKSGLESRRVNVPYGYSHANVQRWLLDRGLLKPGEEITAFHNLGG